LFGGFAIFSTTLFPEKQLRAFPKQLRILKLPNVSCELNVCCQMCSSVLHLKAALFTGHTGSWRRMIIVLV